jgi:hypothetical protein
VTKKMPYCLITLHRLMTGLEILPGSVMCNIDVGYYIAFDACLYVSASRRKVRESVTIETSTSRDSMRRS